MVLTERQTAVPTNQLHGSALVREAIELCLGVFNAPRADYADLDNFDSSTDVFGWTAARWQMKGLEDAYGIELMVLFALAGLVVCLSFSALAMQYRARTQHPKVFWFFRKHYHNNSKVPYVVPHPLNVVLAATMFTAIQLIIYLAFSFDTWQRNLNARAVRIGSWFAVVWLPFFAAVWMSGFGSLYLTFLAPAQFTRRGSLTGVKKRVSPALINALCYLVPVAAVAIIFPLQVMQASRLIGAMRRTYGLTTLLESLSTTFQATGAVPEDSLLNLVTKARRAREAVDRWRVFWSAELATWCVFSLLAMAVSVPLCTALVMSIHRRIRRIAATSAHLPTFSAPPSFDEQDTEGPKPMLTVDTLAVPEQSVVFCASPTSARSLNFPSAPPSAVQSPSTKEYLSSPFFPSPVPSSADLLNSPASGRGRQSSALSKASMQNLRRMSQYAIFPGASTPDINSQSKAELAELNRRYWHVISQYVTVFMVMAVICAFALYETSVDLSVLTDCHRTNLAVVVVSFTFCALVSVWLVATIWRLASQKTRSGKFSPTSANSPRGSRSGLSAYTLSKNSIVGRDTLQLRRGTSLPSISLGSGLRIDFDSTCTASDRRPSQADSRRRSMHRPSASLDLMDALAIAPQDDLEMQDSPPRFKP